MRAPSVAMAGLLLTRVNRAPIRLAGQAARVALAARPALAAPVVLAVLVGWWSGSPVTAAQAAPTLSVKARTELELDPIRRDPAGIVVRGRLVDKFSRAGIGWVDINVQIDQTRRRPVTTADGSFEARFAIAGGNHDVHVEFSGNLHLDPSSYEIQDFDVSRTPLDLELRLSRSVVNFAATATRRAKGENSDKAPATTLDVQVRAKTDFGGVPIVVELSLGDDNGAAKSQIALPSARTDSDGLARITIDSSQLGKPGRKLLLARYRGDDAYDPAETRANFDVRTDTDLEFATNIERSGQLAFEDKFRGDGVLLNAKGGGVAGGAVVLMVGSRLIAETVTDESGSFSYRVSASEIGSGSFNVQAVFEPARAWRRSSRSKPLKLQIAEPTPVPVSYTIAAFAATAFALLAFVSLRTKPWQAWLERWNALRNTDGSPHDRGGSTMTQRTSAGAATGLLRSRPGLASTLRRTKDRGFTGTVRNALDQRALPDAVVVLHLLSDASAHAPASTNTRNGNEDHAGPAPVRATADRHGRFAVDSLKEGIWHASVSAAGFVSEDMSVEIPHRGELRDVYIDLLPVRERIFMLYGAATRPLLPDVALWGVWSPRQIFDHVRSQHGQVSALSTLTSFVEEAYFSQRTPHERQLVRARELVTATQAELPPSGRGHPGASDRSPG